MEKEIHVHIKRYSRLDGIKKKWAFEIKENLSLKIKEGILFVLFENKIVEAVFLLNQENVKIAWKENIIAVAYIDQGFVTRFRIIFSNSTIESRMKPVIKVIGFYNPIIRIRDNVADCVMEKRKEQNPIAPFNKTEAENIIEEVSLKKLKALIEVGEDESQKEIISTLILDPKFLQYVIMLNKTIRKRERDSNVQD
ncbi:uncharacterized protein LOC142333450 [Lycorma delicatula]|uniref:uncharacterized protein LOC142333450 n=1 Tax=Lycorma delicatula TaxID=130591 RepID=UPI003F513A0B